MDRTVWISAVVFVVLAVVGVWFALSPSTIGVTAGDAEGVRVIGGALLAGGLAAFLVVMLQWDSRRREG